jgi:hypothetical protein
LFEAKFPSLTQLHFLIQLFFQVFFKKVLCYSVSTG